MTILALSGNCHHTSLLHSGARAPVRRVKSISRPLGRLKHLLALGTVVVFTTGCAVGPDFARPDASKLAAYHAEPLPGVTASTDIVGGEQQKILQGDDVPGQWWKLFGSAALDTLVDESLRANPDIQSARASLSAAMENVKAQQGAYFPTIAGSFNASRNSNAVVPSPTLASGQLLFNLYQAQIGANWAIDLWGGNRRAVEVLQAQADAQRFQLESVYLALAANVVAAAVQEASLREQISAAEDIVKVEGESLDILRHQNEAGQVAGADVAAQEAALAQAQQALLPLKKQLAQERDLLTQLAGRVPSQQIAQTFELSSIHLPLNVPISIPSKLVEQRPDIRIAEENMHAASAQIGVAIANMLPNFAITATGGNVATQASQLFTPGSSFWTLAGGVTQPLFDGGTLLHKTRAARDTYAQAVAQYQSAVDTAFQNVADVLYALQYDAEILKASAASERAAADSLSITRNQLRLGAINYVALLASQQAYQQAVINRVQAQSARLTDTAVLFQAIGGGWWNRSDVLSERMADANEPQK
jgi:NodT family efflux transporter outer membrane factor (OMF) lipoprotein